MREALTIRKRSWLLRWAYLTSEHGPPPRTDVCTLFWRSVVLTPLVGLFVAYFIFCVVVLLAFFFCGIHWLGPWFGTAATVLLAWGLLTLRDRIVERETTTLNAVNLVVERAKSYRERHCRIVEVVGGNSR